MSAKITEVRPQYPENEEPNLYFPEKYNEHYRFLLGRLGSKPLVAVCMNPSAASEDYSDRTINRIISASQKLGYDGWVVVNLYPERSTDARNLSEFDESLLEKNIQVILDFIIKHQIDEVWGAWGNLTHSSLLEGKAQLLNILKSKNIKVFSFAPLTKQGEPVHPLNRSVKQTFTEDSKIYLDF